MYNYFSTIHINNVGPTLKLKRFFVLRKYASTINSMYKQAESGGLQSKL
jgi:hypothetical protein